VPAIKNAVRIVADDHKWRFSARPKTPDLPINRAGNLAARAARGS
jgi:hypothetical protein